MKSTQTKVALMIDGNTVITGNFELSELEQLADDQGFEIRTIRNPNQVGLRDQFEAWIESTKD